MLPARHDDDDDEFRFCINKLFNLVMLPDSIFSNNYLSFWFLSSIFPVFVPEGW